MDHDGRRFVLQAEADPEEPEAGVGDLVPAHDDHRDGHAEVDKAYYSVPPEYVGRKVWVRWDTRLVRIFNRRFDGATAHAGSRGSSPER